MIPTMQQVVEKLKEYTPSIETRIEGNRIYILNEDELPEEEEFEVLTFLQKNRSLHNGQTFQGGKNWIEVKSSILSN